MDHGPDSSLKWCDDSYLQLHASKTKEIFAFNRQRWYLSTVLDDKTVFDADCQKGHSGAVFLEKVEGFLGLRS